MILILVVVVVVVIEVVMSLLLLLLLLLVLLLYVAVLEDTWLNRNILLIINLCLSVFLVTLIASSFCSITSKATAPTATAATTILPERHQQP